MSTILLMLAAGAALVILSALILLVGVLLTYAFVWIDVQLEHRRRRRARELRHG